MIRAKLNRGSVGGNESSLLFQSHLPISISAVVSPRNSPLQNGNIRKVEPFRELLKADNDVPKYMNSKIHSAMVIYHLVINEFKYRRDFKVHSIGTMTITAWMTAKILNFITEPTQLSIETQVF
jgi:hypothetical protein